MVSAAPKAMMSAIGEAWEAEGATIKFDKPNWQSGCVSRSGSLVMQWFQDLEHGIIRIYVHPDYFRHAERLFDKHLQQIIYPQLRPGKDGKGKGKGKQKPEQRLSQYPGLPKCVFFILLA
eukprot:4159155-Amphidinium_carterae.1